MVLLTAFEPFDGTGVNASEEAVRAFVEGGGGEVAVRILPVRYGADVVAVQAAVRELGPRVILHTGQTGGARVAVERLAVNVRTVPDEFAAVRRGDAPQAP